MEERYVGEGRSAPVFPIVLGNDLRGLCGLRLVSKTFRDALLAVPLHVTVRTLPHVRSLARAPLADWKIPAVLLDLARTWSTGPQPLVHAACALPDMVRKRIVTARIPGSKVDDLAPVLHKLERLRHMIIVRANINLDRLSFIERLDLQEPLFDLQVLTFLLHASCVVLCFTNSQCAICVQRAAASEPLNELHVRVQEGISKMPNLHTLRFLGGVPYLSLDAVAQCPALRVLELGHTVHLKSPGAMEEALQRLGKSSLQLLMFRFSGLERIVRIQAPTSAAPTAARQKALGVLGWHAGADLQYAT